VEGKRYSENTEKLMPKKLSSRHRALMRRLLAGMTLKEACQELGYSEGRASLIVNSPLFQEEMEKMRKEIEGKFVEAEGEKIHIDLVRERLKRLSEKAVEALEDCLSDRSGSVRVSAAKEILDRSGLVKEEKGETDLYVHPTPGLIEALKTLGKVLKEDGDTE